MLFNTTTQTRRSFLSRTLALLFSLAGAIHITGVPLPVSYLTALPALDQPRVSPDGKSLALVNTNEGKQAVVLIELATMKPLPVASLNFSRLKSLHWKSDEWLLLVLENPDYSLEYHSVHMPDRKVKSLAFANSRWTQLLHLLPDDPDGVLVVVNPFFESQLKRLDLRTGKLRAMDKGPGGPVFWMTNTRGEPVGGTGFSWTGFDRYLVWRAAPDAEWQKKPMGKVYDDPSIQLVGVHADGRRFVAIDYDPSGSAYTRLIAYDPATEQKEILMSAPDADIDGVLSSRPLTGGFDAATYENDRPRVQYFDSTKAQIQATIDRALPETTNHIESQSRDTKILIVRAKSERDPGTFYLLDLRSGRLAPLGPSYAGWDARQMGTSRPISFAARDGLILHGRLTMPPGSEPTAKPPLVLLTGDFVNGPRARREFSTLVQLLATRGYAVAMIDPRGTLGYGHAYAAAGKENILEAKALDLADAAGWLRAEGLVDPQKVVLFGRSYGGWAGVHALAKTSAFQGWINWQIPMRLSARTDVSDRDRFRIFDSRLVADLNIVGGVFAAERYAERQAPHHLLDRIDVPSFHYYYMLPTSLLWDDGDMALKRYKGDPKRHVFAYERYSETRAELDAQSVAIHEQMLAYLARNFPTALNQVP